jgi:hypothetical protein
MRLPRFRTIVLGPLILFALIYLGVAVVVLLDDDVVAPIEEHSAEPLTVAIFGASGTAGDGILKAALASPDIGRIHVITRRKTPRIDSGIDSGKVLITLQLDYVDYAAIRGQIADVQAVYWAIGTSSFGVDEETYGRIHVDFPVRFVTAWLEVSGGTEKSFHYISSSDISADSRMMWAREKVRAENTLFEVAAGSDLRVIAYRPDYIGPTKEEAHIGQDILYWFFAPVSAAVRSKQIGQAMIEVTVRADAFANGDRVGTRSIIKYSDAYQHRHRAGD